MPILWVHAELEGGITWTSSFFKGGSMKIIGGPLDKDIHVAGILNFDIAKDLGCKTYYMGPANSVEDFVKDIKRIDPDIVAISYRLSPETTEEP